MLQRARANHPGLLVGFFLFGLIGLLPAPEGLSEQAWRTAAVTLLMASWWISEAIPIYATALLPILLFPLLGIASVGEATAPYANPVIYLFLGGFLLAAGMQRWSLHRRFALSVIRVFGVKPRSVILGFMIASAVLSMFVSNTATAIMMLPIAMSVFELVEGQSRSGRSGTGQSQAGHPQTEHSQAERRNFEIALVLSVAYGCNVGGIGTLIGTPPNALLAGFFQETYGVEIGFLDWMLVGMPIVLISLPVIFFLLTRVLFPIRMQELDGGMDYIRGELAQMGPMSVQEKRVAMVFALAALGWVTRPLLEEYVPGLSDAGISVGAAVLLFMIPAGGDKKAGRGIFSGSVGVQGMGGVHIGHKKHKESEDASSGASQTRLLHWRNTTQLPWGILILFGGGLSMAAAIQSTGLAAWIGTSLSIFQNLPILLMVFLIVLMMIFLTELTSNTASTAAFLPVLAALALGTGADPILFAVPAAIAASCAFMLPVATPPNAIVYGTGRITISEMSKAGLWLNLLFSVWITLASYFLLRWIFTG